MWSPIWRPRATTTSQSTLAIASSRGSRSSHWDRRGHEMIQQRLKWYVRVRWALVGDRPGRGGRVLERRGGSGSRRSGRAVRDRATRPRSALHPARPAGSVSGRELSTSSRFTSTSGHRRRAAVPPEPARPARRRGAGGGSKVPGHEHPSPPLDLLAPVHPPRPGRPRDPNSSHDQEVRLP